MRGERQYRQASGQYRHLLDSFVDPHAAPQLQQPQSTPSPARRRSSFGTQRVDLHDVTAILRVSIQVEGFHFDSSIMEHPEFRIRTVVIFQSRQLGSQHVETSWRVHRTFPEFQGLDLQLRQKYPFDMCEIPPPRLHRRRTFFRMHKTKAFLNKRSLELHAYLAQVLNASSSMRLTRFMDPRAPLILRYFCNFDSGFGRKLRVVQPEDAGDGVWLDRRHPHSHHSHRPPPRPPSLSPTDSDSLGNPQDQSLARRQAPRRARTDSKFDELEAHLLEDRARNLHMCQRFACSCHDMPWQLNDDKMARILRRRGQRVSYRPRDGDGPSALLCVLFRLQQYNPLDRKLHAILSPGSPEHEQLRTGAASLREALTDFALLHVHALAPHFRSTVLALTKQIHEFKSGQRQRVGALELVLLCSMLDLTIVLVTNDHDGTVQEIFPLAGLSPLRRGGRLLLTLGYLLPTMASVNGLYLLATEEEEDQPLDAAVWMGLDHTHRALSALVEVEAVQSELRRLEPFDAALAEPLNRALLDAVWDDCGHNPHAFHVFQRQARQFGKGRASAAAFVEYLAVAFGADGAAYLVDFLLFVLPEATLRKQLFRARWRHVQRRLRGASQAG